MGQQMLETIVQLASAGTSGVCVLAIFWSGVCLQRLPRDAADGRYRSFRHFMAMCVLIALISAGAATASTFFRYHNFEDLTQELTITNAELADSEKEGAQLRTRVAEASDTLQKQRQELARAFEEHEESAASKNAMAAELKGVKSKYAELQDTHNKAMRRFIDVPGGGMLDRERPQ